MSPLLAAVLPLAQYDMFSWREDSFYARLGESCTYAHTGTTPYCNRIRFQHVHVTVLGGREVDMPYGLWEDLHRLLIRANNAQFLNTNHPMLHVFYKSMDTQLYAVTKCRPELHRNIPPVLKFLFWGLQCKHHSLGCPYISMYVCCTADSNLMKGSIAHILAAFVVVWNRMHLCKFQDCCARSFPCHFNLPQHPPPTLMKGACVL